ncbi:hypothetical protein CWE09_01125 [Aliidiomarina minuta]|uniref:Adhesin domain-containing protein n=1 Tax=Aliidiomarina minuta TaxID=880057 RepID=A0A432W5L5_9GAMM|nr:hypothetical protein [Aliidiomarina minuta]RUO25368.1 hypothetical protein CWE09_01125 [Aliidiomarina minuta]
MSLRYFLTTLVILAVFVTLGQASASSEAERHYRFESQNVRVLHIDNAVGQLDIKRSTDNEIRIEVVFEGKRGGLLRRKTDVSDVELNVRERGDQLYLEFQQSKVQADWVVYMPELDALHVHLGVGTADIDLGDTGLELQVGVGTALINSHKNFVGQFRGSAGVGSVSASGLDNYTSQRRVVAEDAKGTGNGDKDINVEVGVGDIKLSL